MTRRLNLLLLGLLLVVGAPTYWLLIDNRPGDAAAKPVTITQLRALAASLPGPAPQRVEMELVGYGRLPGTMMVAGGGLKRDLLGVLAFRLPVAGGQPVVVDTGLSAAIADQMGMERFDPTAQARVDAALREAGLILLTHEHFDHEGGLATLGDPAVLAKALLNPGQLPGNALTDLMPWPKGVQLKAGIVGSAPRAVAPGVVVIPAPSHTPGSQMVYVRLSSGREVLFAGDIATMARSWQQLRARSRLIGNFVAQEDRAEVFAWLRTIRAFKAAAPGLLVIAGHDYEWIHFQEGHYGIQEHFSPPAPINLAAGKRP